MGLLDMYSHLSDPSVEASTSFSEITDEYNTVDGLNSLADSIEYWMSSDFDSIYLSQIYSSYMSNLVEYMDLYSGMKGKSETIEQLIDNANSELKSFESRICNDLISIIEAQKPDIENVSNEDAKTAITAFELYVEGLKDVLPYNDYYISKVNEYILDCYNQLTQISNSQSKDYQLWVYETIMDAQSNLDKKKPVADDFASFFSINSNYITVPEVLSLYSDTLKKVVKEIGDGKYQELLKLSLENGLKSYEDF